MGMNFYAKKINNKETKQRLTKIVKDNMPTKQENYNDVEIKKLYETRAMVEDI